MNVHSHIHIPAIGICERRGRVLAKWYENKKGIGQRQEWPTSVDPRIPNMQY